MLGYALFNVLLSKKAEMPATAVVARILSVPGLALTVTGPACVPPPLKARNVDAAPADHSYPILLH